MNPSKPAKMPYLRFVYSPFIGNNMLQMVLHHSMLFFCSYFTFTLSIYVISSSDCYANQLLWPKERRECKGERGKKLWQKMGIMMLNLLRCLTIVTRLLTINFRDEWKKTKKKNVEFHMVFCLMNKIQKRRCDMWMKCERI